MLHRTDTHLHLFLYTHTHMLYICICRYTFGIIWTFLLKMHSRLLCFTGTYFYSKSHERWGFVVPRKCLKTPRSKELYISTHMFHDHLPHLGLSVKLCVSEKGTLDVLKTPFWGSWKVMSFLRGLALHISPGVRLHRFKCQDSICGTPP